MAYSKNYNTIKSTAQMTRTLGYPASFNGVDVSRPERAISDSRFAYAMNMWKDYDSESGACIETFPGWRNIRAYGNAVYGMWRYGEWILVHTGAALKAFKHELRDGSVTVDVISSGIAQRKSAGFVANGSFYLLDGTTYRKITYNGTTWSSGSVSASAYVPTLYASHTIIDGVAQQYEQRNMLTDGFKETFVVSGDDVEVISGTFGIKYEIISETYHTCRAVGGSLSGTTIYIPGRIKIGGVEYTVEEIGTFSSPAAYTTLWIGEGVKRINPRAFYAFSSLSTLHLPKSLEIIGSQAFGQCVTTISVYLDTPGIDYAASDISGSIESSLHVAGDAFNTPSEPPLPNLYANGTNEEIAAIKILEAPGTEYFDSESWASHPGSTIPAEPQPKYVVKLGSDWTGVTSVVLAGTTIHEYSQQSPQPTYYGTIAGYYGTGYPAFWISTDSADNLIGKQVTIVGTLRSASISGQNYLNCINKCTLAAEFDGRIFLGGNPSFPNRIWYTQRDIHGVNLPEYIGELNFWQDGAAGDANVSMLVASNMLCVLQKQKDGSGGIWLHQGVDTGSDLTPRVYPSTFGSIDSSPCGACCNFRDDAVFLTRHGLEAIAKQTVNLDRSIEHRSTNVDNKLLRENLGDAKMTEWNGYLMLLCPTGNVYMADSRQMYRNQASGYAEYEWYLLDEFGMYSGMTPVEGSDEMTGGTFAPATIMLSTEGVLYFGTSLGRICVVNTDKRGQSYTWSIVPVNEDENEGDDDDELTVTEPVDPGRIHRHWYTRAGRRYSSFVTTKFDDCGYPHVNKNTVRKSVDIELRTYYDATVSISWRTDRDNVWSDPETNNRFALYEEDFGNHTFDTAEHNIAVSDEHAKLWVMKQFHLRSDGYRSAWGLYHISYRWKVCRRIRNE